ncbi:ATP-binding protein [Streptomyces sp. NPDC048018]|uniref:ATP-binding protein n=1 Tax=Streptomyces sp. NPDC048018 TaxID=3365499 RepID=UPI00371E4D14
MAGRADRLWQELGALYDAAGRPTLSRLVRLGRTQRPPAAVADSTLSGWLRGQTVPGPGHTRYFLVMTAYLQSEAARAGRAHPAHPDHWWRELLLQARRERDTRRPARGTSTPERRPDGAEEGPAVLPSAPARRAVPDALSALPRPGAGFVGRDRELHRLLTLLDPSRADPSGSGTTVASPVAVSGLGGVGKTSLALRAAHEARRRGWFPGGVLFVDLHGAEADPVTPDNAVQTMLRALGVEPERTPPTPDERAGLHRSLLERIAAERGPVLLLADNAATSSQILPLLSGHPSHRTLLTSRSVLTQLGAHQLRLGMLAPDAALEALDTALKAADTDDRRVERDDAAARRVCVLCGHLPLALQIAAALLVADPGKPVAELAEELEDMATRMEFLDDGERAVEAAFDLSRERLTADQCRLFHLLALGPGPHVSPETLTASHGGRVPVRAVEALVRAHLLEPRDASGRWHMHDLVRTYAMARARADSRLEGELDDARARLLDHYITRAGGAREQLLSAMRSTAPGGSSVRAEALVWLDAERTSLVAAAHWAVQARHAPQAVELALHLGEYFGWRRLHDDAVAVYEHALEAARELNDSLAEGKCANNLGVSLRHMRRNDAAVETFRAALCAYARVPGTETGQGRTWQNLGSALSQLHRFDEAVDAYAQAVRIAEETADAHALGRAENGRAGVLIKQDRPAEALVCLHRARELLPQIEDPVLEGLVHNHIGRVLRRTGRLEEAEHAHRRARDVFLAIEDAEGEATCRNDRALVLADGGRFGEAVAEQRAALAVLHEVGARWREATVSHDLGLSLQGLGDLQEAAAAFRHAASLFREVDDRHDVGRCEERLASIDALVARTREA